MARFDLYYGASLGFDHCWMTGRVADDVDEGKVTHVVIEWTADAGPRVIRIPAEPMGLAVTTEPNPTLLVGYPFGSVAALQVTKSHVENLDMPNELGPLRLLRKIDRDIFTVGMGRQVYRRDYSGIWRRYDEGLRTIPRNRDELSGLNSIHGLSGNDLVVAGMRGDLWQLRHGAWTRIDIPTNVMLNDVHMVNPDLIFACGKSGVLLRGKGDSWEFVGDAPTAVGFLSLAWFRDTLFVADGSRVYRLLDDDSLATVDIGSGENQEIGWLDVDRDVLWAFGAGVMSRTKDGVNWIAVDVDFPLPWK